MAQTYPNSYELNPIIKRRYYNTVYQNKQNDQQFLKELRALASQSTFLANPFKTNNLEEQHIQNIVENAKIHQKANRTSDTRILQNNNTSDKVIEIDQPKCQCGCRRQICEPIPLYTSLNEMNFLGTATLLYFFYLKIANVIGCIFLFLGIYSFVTNMKGNDGVNEINECQEGYFCLFKVHTSFVKKLNQHKLVQAQYWLSMVISIALIIVSWVTTYYGKKIQKSVEIQTQFPSQKAIKISNIPFGRASQTMLLQALKQTWLARKKRRASSNSSLQIKALHIVYNMKFVRKLIDSIEQQAQHLAKNEVVSLRTSKIKIKQDEYIELKNKLMRNLAQLEDCLKKFNNEQQYRKNISTTCAIVEFESSKQRDKFIQIFGIDNSSIFSMLKNILFKSCLQQTNTMLQGSALVFQRAPQPEDVYWKNCQIKYNACVSIGIFFAAVVIVLASLGILVAIDYAQLYLNNNTSLPQVIFDIVNYSKTILIIIFNKVIYICLQLLLAKAKSQTLSQQKSYLIWISILAQSVNSIALPFIIQGINPNTTKRFYGGEGVAGIAFDFSVVNVLSLSALTFFDPQYFIFKFILWTKCLRNWTVRYLCKGIDPISLKFIVPSVNKLYEAGNFDISESYSQIGVMLLHMSFFASMCPFIIIIYSVGFLMIYFLKRYLLIRRYNYPPLLDKTIFINGIKIIKIIPILIGTGMITTILITYHDYEKLFIPSSICIFLGFINLANPFGCFDLFTSCVALLFGKMCKIKQQLKVSTISKTRYIEYYETNHLSTLFGFRNILSKGVVSKEDLYKVQQFVESFKYKEEFELSTIQFNKQMK